MSRSSANIATLISERLVARANQAGDLAGFDAIEIRFPFSLHLDKRALIPLLFEATNEN